MPSLPSGRGRRCEGCGNQMPFGVRRRRQPDGSKVCEGCANGRPGRSRMQGSLDQRIAFDLVNTTSGSQDGTRFNLEEFRDPVHGFTAEVHDNGGKIAWLVIDPDGQQAFGGPAIDKAAAYREIENVRLPAHLAGPPGAPQPPPFLQDPPGAKAPGAPPAVPGAAPEPGMEEASPLGEPAPPPGGGLGTFAPDLQSDKIVRLCCFCGSGQVTGNSDGSITCGHEDVTFLVEVLPQHPFQPLVNPDGTPFEMTTDDDRPPPGIGIATTEGAPAPDPMHGTVPGQLDTGVHDETELPPFLKGGAVLINRDGIAMAEDDYVEHLARQLSS